MELTHLLAAVILGCAVGAATGLIPGLHVNTLVAIAAAWQWDQPVAVVAWLSVGIVHTFVSILPATYLGAPDPSTALAMLPAHQMLMDGQAATAIRVSALSSLGALLMVVAAAPLYHWLLTGPADAATWIDRLAPWLLGSVLAVLLMQERHRLGIGRAVLVQVAAGLVAWMTWELPLRGIAGPASPLLPLLAGLFGVPTLLWALRAGAPVPLQDPPAPVDRQGAAWWSVTVGTLAAAVTAVLPGVTAATATALASPRQAGPVRVVATLSAVNTAHASFALALLFVTGQARTGLAQHTAAGLSIQAWDVGSPPSLLTDLAWVAVASGLLAAAATMALDVVARRHVHRVPGRVLSAAALVFIVAICAVLAGPVGLLVMVAAATVGALPLALGVRRVHLSASLILPILVSRLLA